MTKQFLKSTGAVLTGLIGVVLLSIGTDYILEKAEVFPTYPNPLTVSWMVLLATFYRTVYAIAGSFMAAFLAPHRPMRHALILGFIGLGLNIIGVLVIWGPGKNSEFSQIAQQTPAWYSLALVALAIPGAWLGGWLQNKRIKFTS